MGLADDNCDMGKARKERDRIKKINMLYTVKGEKKLKERKEKENICFFVRTDSKC